MTNTPGVFPTLAAVPSTDGIAFANTDGITFNVVSANSPLPVTVDSSGMIIGTIDIDQTTPGTTNGVVTNTGSVTNATLQSGSTTIVTQTTNNNLQSTLVGKGAEIVVTPTVTASSYTAGFVVGGIMTFSSALTPTQFNGILQSICLTFKGSVQSTEFDLCLFNTSPSNGTYTDHTTPTWSASDNQYLLGVYPLLLNYSPLGTQTVYTLDGVGKQITGATTALYGVLVSKSASTNNYASTSDVSVRLGLIW